jgi:hypothetical protein
MRKSPMTNGSRQQGEDSISMNIRTHELRLLREAYQEVIETACTLDGLCDKTAQEVEELDYERDHWEELKSKELSFLEWRLQRARERHKELCDQYRQACERSHELAARINDAETAIEEVP